MSLLTNKIRKTKGKIKIRIHFETNRVFRELNKQFLKELDRVRLIFRVETVPMTRREKSQMITASEFLQI
jgi:hypothetical protein